MKNMYSYCQKELEIAQTISERVEKRKQWTLKKLVNSVNRISAEIAGMFDYDNWP